MKAAEIRSRFLKFFEELDHTVVGSSSLVPHNDPTLLFTNAGMNQFKDNFTGREKPSFTRATSVQKVVRAGGKHNDLENVGFTARHHTFFEMLGNFSFGDYFKKDAIRFAWDFLTKELNISVDDLYVTVHVSDDEAEDIWVKDIGFPLAKVTRLDEDNFWSMGDIGPCGPSSEIFVDRGEQYSCGKVDCKVGCECDRYMEIWNLVFMQFDRDSSGKMTPLPSPCVDTGMGLERVTSFLQKVDTNYDIDAFLDIMKKTSGLVGKEYQPGTEDSFAFRVIADHSRATTFLIGDGVIPSNEGRGDVLRRIIRRAIRYGRNLGFQGPFLSKVCSFVVDQMSGPYPDLNDKKQFIQKLVQGEEELFLKTLDRGLNLLDEAIANQKGKSLAGDVAFRLYDTFGFPLDLTTVICAEQGLTVDEKVFADCMEKQRSQSRKNWKGAGESVADIYHQVSEKLKANNQNQVFVGYDEKLFESKLIAMVHQKGGAAEIIDASENHDVVELVFERTPFYGESGGQVGDSGMINGHGFSGKVIDVQKPVSDLIVAKVKVVSGSLKVGQKYNQAVDLVKQRFTSRNHTATHILQWALRTVLGDHVKQAGSFVSDELLRFDFSHFQALTSEELGRTENMINEKIWQAANATKDIMSKDKATESGAIAFFGEKYGDEVRVVSVGDYSTELCGGIHVENTSEIGLFKIAAESSVAAGVRRIVAYTSKRAFEYLQEKDHEAKVSKNLLKANNAEEIETKIEKLFITEKTLRKEIEKSKSQDMGALIDDLIKSAKMIGATPFISSVLPEDGDGVKTLRSMADKIRQKSPNSVVVLGMKQVEKQKAFVLAAVGKEAPSSVKANEIIKIVAPVIEGRGGGKADMAQAGGSKLEGLDQLVDIASQAVQASLS